MESKIGVDGVKMESKIGADGVKKSAKKDEGRQALGCKSKRCSKLAVEKERAGMMLIMSDTSIEKVLPYFANAGVHVAFLVPTQTGYEKSIMDATAPVRQLLFESGVHDYESQGQGPENKILVPSHLVGENDIIDTIASLYRPVTKKGDPRIWFSNLKKYCRPCNLLALIIIKKEIYVFNLSDQKVVDSLQEGTGLPAFILSEASSGISEIANELLEKLRDIHNIGFLESITSGDPGVGDTLEHALGINRNNSKKPDYKGIELKATRITRNGSSRAKTRSTLFTKTPDEGMSYREIVEKYGKWQTPRNAEYSRLQLYETFRCSRANAYDLILQVDENAGKLNMYHQTERLWAYVSAWNLQTLKDTLVTKHPETFWIKAVSENHDGIEYFRYDEVLYTKNPNASLLAPLLETDKITVDLAAHFKSDGKWRDHGILFKMMSDDFPLLFGEPEKYIL